MTTIADMTSAGLQALKARWWKEAFDADIGGLCRRVAVERGEREESRYRWAREERRGSLEITVRYRDSVLLCTCQRPTPRYISSVARRESRAEEPRTVALVNGRTVFDNSPSVKLYVPGIWLEIVKAAAEGIEREAERRSEELEAERATVEQIHLSRLRNELLLWYANPLIDEVNSDSE